jgi:predicted DNA-binding transcriptional regulator AlpA
VNQHIRTQRPDALLVCPPRGMRREKAAEYVGVSPSKFDAMVADKRMPSPKQVDGCVIWDRLALDVAFTALPDRDEGNSWVDR